jgi:hypothetical protein
VNVLPPIAPIDSIPEPGPTWLVLLAVSCAATVWLVRAAWGHPPRRRRWVYFSGGSGPVSSSTDRPLRLIAVLPLVLLLAAILAGLLARL